MALALVLRLDETSAAAVRALWQALAEAGLDDHALRLGTPPHLTLARFADDAEPRLLLALARDRPARARRGPGSPARQEPGRILPDDNQGGSGADRDRPGPEAPPRRPGRHWDEEGGSGAVPAQPWPALALKLAGFGVFPASSPGETAWLWLAPAPSAALLRMQAELAALAPPDPQDAPGARVPHVTLGRGDAGRMLALLAPLWRGPIAARAVALELVRFPPPLVLGSLALPA